MQDVVIKNIIRSLMEHFDGMQLQKIENALYLNLNDYVITKCEQEKELTADISPDVQAVQMFFVAKKVEGLTIQSLKYYKSTLSFIFNKIQKPLSSISTNDIRVYFAMRKVSQATIDNERRVLSTFFGWLHNEEYITTNPMKKVKKVKQPKVVKKPFTVLEIEELRDAAKNIREKAIIDVLLSTGMRCGELCGLNKSDVDLSTGEMIVTGKGNKQRTCYLNAPAIKKLKDYLATRADDFKPLFIALNQGSGGSHDNRLGISGTEIFIRKLGKSVGISDVHPHRFRRTAATQALKRGMPIEQVKIMLGHESIDTTLRYAITADETVKQSHARYM
jgi:site-specific recombinase XerD